MQKNKRAFVLGRGGRCGWLGTKTILGKHNSFSGENGSKQFISGKQGYISQTPLAGPHNYHFFYKVEKQGGRQRLLSI